MGRIVILLSVLGLCRTLPGEILYLRYPEFEKMALERNPMLREKALEVDKQIQKLNAFNMSMILPKFEVEMGMGPAPGLKNRYDFKPILRNETDSTDLSMINSSRVFDFQNWGPVFGMEFNVMQPLNIHRIRSGYHVYNLNILMSREEYYKEEMETSLQSQEIYFGYLLADKMLKETTKAKADFDKADEKIEAMLDEENSSVSQTDLLRLRTGRFDLEKGSNKANTGFKKAVVYARFFLALPESLEFCPADSVLTRSSVVVPLLDTLKLWLLERHPDFKRLENGLKAREELINVARGELGPDLAVLGRVSYSKAWSSNRASGGQDVFTRDPLNELDGYFGLGLRFNLNVWSRYQKLKKEKLDLKQLKRKEVYALRGLMMQLEEAYTQFQEAEANLKAASNSLRASEAWLKGSAMAYDLDPSQSREMISSYKSTLLAKEDYFTAVFDYNMAIGKVIYACGWTYTDFLGKISLQGKE